MTFIEAIRSSQWVRRRGWPGWMLVSRTGAVLRASSVKWNELTWADLTATDWQSYVMQDEEPEDTHAMRFRLMELE